MDSPDDAQDYDSMDHTVVNEVCHGFVEGNKFLQRFTNEERRWQTAA